MSDDAAAQAIAVQQIEKADVYLQLGRYQEALPLIAKAIAADPNNSYWFYKLAAVHNALHNYNDAITAAKSALALNPNNDDAHIQLAISYHAQKNFTRSLEHARSAARILPDHPYNLYYLARFEFQSGHTGKALAAAQQALQLDPEDPDLHRLLGDLTFAIKDGRRAALHYREALRYAPDDAHLHYNLGLALSDQSQWQEALDAFLTAVKLQPADTDYKQAIFNVVHHHIADSAFARPEQQVQDLDPLIQQFYLDELKRRNWQHKLGIMSLATLWLLALLAMAVLFSFKYGGPDKSLLLIVAALLIIYLVLYISNRIMNSRVGRFLQNLKQKIPR